MDFYTRVLGLQPARRGKSEVSFSSGGNRPPLLTLTEESDAVAGAATRSTLGHFALRYATRSDLARACRQVVQRGYRIDCALDHGVSEAVYVRDPDGYEVELCADRLDSERPRRGELEILTTELDLEQLLAEAGGRPEAGRARAPELGHIHLQVEDLARSERFYSEYLGFGVRQRASAAFFGTGIHQQQVVVDACHGKGSSDGMGLLGYRIEVPLTEILYCLSHRAPLLGYETRTGRVEEGILEVRDPNGCWLEIEAPRIRAGLEAGVSRPGARCSASMR